MQNYYSQILELMKEVGDPLVEKAGKIADIGIKKAWLTEFDIQIEKEFIKLISTFAGEHVVYAEEINKDYVEKENVWVIDPISHTFSFIHGLPHYTVVVSHLYKGKTVFAAAYDPSVKELFMAEKNKGMFLNGEKVSVNKSCKDLCFMYDPQMPCSKYDKQQRLSIMSMLMEIGRNKTLGSACLLYAYVAVGRAHAAIDMNKDNFTCIPGTLMVKEAGGEVTDFKGESVDINTIGLVASNKIIHDQILEITKEL